VKPNHVSDRVLRNALGLIALLRGGILVRAATQWNSNFDSHEAVGGLMSKHMIQVEFTETVLGTRR